MQYCYHGHHENLKLTQTSSQKADPYLFLSLVEFLRPRQTSQVQWGGAAPACHCQGEIQTVKVGKALLCGRVCLLV